ncbi:hypothetical protein QCA50_014050 [Cerrena zonata]|uniref:Uncharacterized protein n=1 Tax=Cerrena zonata TaxID=2478898 RepID=A0AAW0FTN8_9APHY
MHKNESVDPWMEPFAPFDCDTAQGGNIEGSEVENSGLVSNRVTRPKPEKRGVTSQVSTIGGKVDVPDLLPTLEGLIPIKAEDIDDSELLNYSASHKNKSSVSVSQKKLKAISTV